MNASLHRYALQSLLPDYLRGGAGVAVGGGFWLLAPGTLHVSIIFGGLTVLFLLFTMRTFARQRTRVEMTEDAIASEGLRRLVLRWSELDRIKLRYYSTRRNRSGGWMSLTLRNGRSAITIDSNIGGFDAIAARVARAITDHRIAADDVTLANLAALGCVPAGPEVSADAAGTTP